MWLLAFVILTNLSHGIGKIYFEENFDDDRWSTRWAMSQHEGINFGRFEATSGKFFASANNKGIKTTQDDRFYALSTRFPEFTNENKTLVIQYSVKNERNISDKRCIGAFIELFDCSFKRNALYFQTPYLVKFGPDMCAYNNRTNWLGVTFQYNGENYPINRYIPWGNDVYTHIYTLVLGAQGTYQVLVDGVIMHKGELEDDFGFPVENLKASSFYMFPRICGIGFNFWQSDAGLIFDNVLVTDDVFIAEKRRNTVLDGNLAEQLAKAIQDDNLTEIKRLSEAIKTAEKERKHGHVWNSCSSLLDLQCLQKEQLVLCIFIVQQILLFISNVR